MAGRLAVALHLASKKGRSQSALDSEPDPTPRRVLGPPTWPKFLGGGGWVGSLSPGLALEEVLWEMPSARAHSLPLAGGQGRRVQAQSEAEWLGREARWAWVQVLGCRTAPLGFGWF